MRNGRAPKNSLGKGKTHSFDNAMLKAGATYKLDGHNFFTLNATYGTRAPLADNVYISPRIKDNTILGLKSERVLSGDLSYIFNYSRVRGKSPDSGPTATTAPPAARSTMTTSRHSPTTYLPESTRPTKA